MDGLVAQLADFSKKEAFAADEMMLGWVLARASRQLTDWEQFDNGIAQSFNRM